MAEYSFLSIWTVEAPIGRVWEVIKSAESYPEWFPYVAESVRTAEGDKAGVGSRYRSRWTTALPYGFEFESETTRVQEPSLLELRSSGELDGLGRWRLIEDDRATTVTYEWIVQTTKPWMNLMRPLLKPAFAWNHAVLMKAGGEGLAGKLNAPLLRNESYTRESSSPLTPIMSVAGTVALARWLLGKGKR